MSYRSDVPLPPRVISPSPTPSDKSDAREDYFPPVTRSSTRRQRIQTPQAISEEGDEDDAEAERLVRARSPTGSSTRHRTTRSKDGGKVKSNTPVTKSEPLANGFLAPPNGHPSPFQNLKDRWRDFSRSPSPLGLIPLHRRYRTFIHKHEIPRKALHVSIGFLTLEFYRRGIQTSAITPWLLSALVPIAATDIIRHKSDRVNRFYIRSLGALMRETEVDGYNGVIWYLLGAYIVLRFFSKDVGVMGVLLLSWCDTAASTFGRLYGRYTIRLRRGKSLAGTLAAWITGCITAAMFWGWFVPYIGSFPDDPEGAFMFHGRLNLLPNSIRSLLGWNPANISSGSVVSGPVALGALSVVSGFIAAGSEFLNLFGLDDNLTIPVLSGVGLWGFLKVFGY